MENKAAVSRKKNIAGTVIMLFSIVLTVSIVLRDHSLTMVSTALHGADWGWIAAGFFLMLLHMAFDAASMRLLFRSFERRLGWGRALSYSCVGFYFSAITPSATGGQPMQAYYMRQDGIELSQSTFTLMVVTSFYQMLILLGGCLAIFIGHSYVTGLPHLIRWLLAFGALVNGFCAVILMSVFMQKKLAESLLRAAVHLLHKLHIMKNEEHWRKKVDESIEEYSKGGAYLKENPLVGAKVFGYTLLKITALNLVPYCACRALHIPHIRVLDFIMRQSLLNLAVTAVPLPGSIGASEGSFILLYQSILSPSKVDLAVILSRGISFYAILAVSGAVVVMLGRMQGRKNRSHSDT